MPDLRRKPLTRSWSTMARILTRQVENLSFAACSTNSTDMSDIKSRVTRSSWTSSAQTGAK